MDRARRTLEEQRSAAPELEDSRYIIRAYVPPVRLFVIGAAHIAQALLPMAALAGFQVHLIEPREAFGADSRPDLTETWWQAARRDSRFHPRRDHRDPLPTLNRFSVSE
jgi:xanthine/CO dehydrogenase XdhC/CoxF family maturation factor